MHNNCYILLFLFATIMACRPLNSQPQRILAYINGVKAAVLLDSESGDTLELRLFHDNGKIFRVFPYKNNKINGIVWTYDVNGELVERSPYIDGNVMLIEKHYSNQLGIDTCIVTYRRVKDSVEINQTITVSRDVITIKNGVIVPNHSYGMMVLSGKDTISINKEYNFTLKLYTMQRDSVFHEVLIGPIDVNMNLSDTLFWASGWNDEFKFSFKPQKMGYNYLFGKVKKIVMQPEIPNIGLDSAFFYTDFYVTE